MKAQLLFLTTILSITVMFQHAYFTFREHFSGLSHYQAKNSILQQQLQAEQLKLALLEYNYASFQTQVAKAMPRLNTETLAGKPAHRSIASVVATPNYERLQSSSLEAKFTMGNKAFKKGNYQSAIEELSQVVSGAPVYSQAVEAHYLLSESYFRDRQFMESLRVTEAMMQLYPEHQLTALSMLRMGDILAEKKQLDRAEEVYRTVDLHFADQSLKAQAQRKLALMGAR